MDKEYIEKRKKELSAEFEKGTNALQELQKQANEISEKMKMIRGAFTELTNQEEAINGKPETKKPSKGTKK